jgi:curli biogenesis system outer membrane secretion channel CsgG
MRTHFIRLLFLLILLSFLAACTTTVMMPVQRPAAINMHDYKKIAIGDLSGGQGTHSQDLMDAFTTKLVEANYFEAVVDRQNLRGLMQEHNLSSSGLVDENSAAQIGKFLGAAALVFGRVQTDKYDETTSSELEKRKDYSTDPPREYVVNCNRRHGVFNMAVHVQVTDVQTAKIVGVQDIMASYTQDSQADNSVAPQIDVDALYTACVKDLTGKFQKLLVPYTVMVSADFETDGKNLPELPSAIQQIKIGETAEALRMLKEMSEKTFPEPKVSGKAIYNYGLLLMYTGHYDESLECFKKALKANPDSYRYPEAVKKAKAEKASAEKLLSQTGGK